MDAGLLFIFVILPIEEAGLLLGGLAGRFLLVGGFLGGSLFAVESLFHLLGVALVVELQQAFAGIHNGRVTGSI